MRARFKEALQVLAFIAPMPIIYALAMGPGAHLIVGMVY